MWSPSFFGDTYMDGRDLYRLVRLLVSVRRAVPLVVAVLVALAAAGLIQPLGDEMDDDALAL